MILPAGVEWFDSHAHLQDVAFSSDLAAVLDRAYARQLGHILLPGASFADSQKALQLASQDDRLVCAVGCHPHEAKEFSNQSLDDWHRLIQDDKAGKIVAIGEIGLDYHYDYSPRQLQQDVFYAQLELAHWAGLPVIIHKREATADCLAILKKAAAAGLLLARPGVFHCFSGSVETARLLLDMGFYIGLDGPVTFKNAKRPLAVASMCPLDRLLLETDSPYLTPVPLRGKRNEPANLPLIGAKIAELKEISLADLARQTTKNACRLFGLK